MLRKHRFLITTLAALACLLWTIPVMADTHEVRIFNSSTDPLGKEASVWCRLGQRLTIPGRYVTEIGYCVWRHGFPQGDITFAIHNATTDEPIVRVVWGDASELGVWPEDSGKFTKVTLNKPIWINGEIRLFVEFNGGDADNYCWAGYRSGDKITGEWYTNYYHYGQWHDIGEAEEGAYYYAWVDAEDLQPTSPDFVMPVWAIGLIAIPLGGLWFYVNKKQHKRHEES
jgi:hypothetical protein